MVSGMNRARLEFITSFKEKARRISRGPVVKLLLTLSEWRYVKFTGIACPLTTAQHIMSFDALNKYFHTSSASARFFKEHPKMKEENPDMIERHTQELRKRVLDERRRGIASNDNLDDDHIRVAWPLGLMMIRKK